MPKEVRPHGHHYRQLSIVMNPEPAVGTRPTTIWTSDDDDILLAARSRGLNWKPIAEQYFPNKTPNACRKRHERLQERQGAEGWDSTQLEAVAKVYFEVRKEMWTKIAERVGEKWAKWQVVEQKVCIVTSSPRPEGF
jgi:hypothetical protein